MRDIVEDDKVVLVKVKIWNIVLDSLTNPMIIEIFSWCRELMGMVSLDS